MGETEKGSRTRQEKAQEIRGPEEQEPEDWAGGGKERQQREPERKARRRDRSRTDQEKSRTDEWMDGVSTQFSMICFCHVFFIWISFFFRISFLFCPLLTGRTGGRSPPQRFPGVWIVPRRALPAMSMPVEGARGAGCWH